MFKRILSEKLFEPVSDKQLKVIFHCTLGFAFLTTLALSGAFGMVGDGILREAFLATSGVLVCVSLCKTLFHEALPAGYIRYGSFILALGYSLVVINEVVMKFQSMVPATV